METLTDPQQELYDWLEDYIRKYQHSPSIRQMMKAMEMKSPAPIQSRLEHLRSKGYIDWNEGKARTIRLTQATLPGVPILGQIAAGGLVEAYMDTEVEHLDFSNLLPNSRFFALRVCGQSMIEALIDDGDIVIMQPVSDPKVLQNGAIVAARLEGQTTLKYFHRKGSRVVLQPGNPDAETYPPIEVLARDIDVQGTLVGVWRESSEDRPSNTPQINYKQSRLLEDPNGAHLPRQTQSERHSFLENEIDEIQLEIDRIKQDAVGDMHTNPVPGVAPGGCSISFYTVKRGSKVHEYYKLICSNSTFELKNSEGKPIKHLHLGKKDSELYQAAMRSIDRRNRLRWLESRLKKLKRFQETSVKVAA